MTLPKSLAILPRFFDTAAIYGAGHNETLVGAALGSRRSQVTLATKCGILPGGAPGGRSVDGSPATIVASCEESLRRLGTDVIDLFYLHRVDPRTPIEDSVQALASLVTAGSVGVVSGYALASSTSMDVVVRGVGGHGDFQFVLAVGPLLPLNSDVAAGHGDAATHAGQ